VKDPFAKFQRERVNRIIQSIFDTARFLNEGQTIEKVMELTGLNKEDVHRVKELTVLFRSGEIIERGNYGRNISSSE
jgi:hypothetical protein